MDTLTFTGTILLGGVLGCMVGVMAMGAVNLTANWKTHTEGYNRGWADAWHEIGVWREDRHPSPLLKMAPRRN